MKTAALIRVSTDLQDLEAQRGAIRSWAGREGAEITWYEEPAVSGAARDRPVLDRLLAAARAGRFEIVVVAALDRVARDVVRLVMTLDELERAGAYVVSLREGIDFRGPMGRAMASLLGAVAEIERAAIRDRVRAGMLNAKARGKTFGRPRFVPSEEELARMLEMKSEGRSIREIAAAMRVIDSGGRGHQPSAAWVHAVLKSACSETGVPEEPEEAAKYAVSGAPPSHSET
jgi:DNA invertase Pin-like site-specific DNA recombinase